MTLRDTAHRIAAAVPGRRSEEPCPGDDGRCEQRGPHSPQRREDFRVPYLREVHVGKPGWPSVRCRSVDLSGSGLRAVVPGLELSLGEEVEVFLRMENGVEVDAHAEVTRSGEQGVTAFRFVALDPQVRELLIRHVFADQRRALSSIRGGR